MSYHAWIHPAEFDEFTTSFHILFFPGTCMCPVPTDHGFYHMSCSLGLSSLLLDGRTLKLVTISYSLS